MARRAKPPMAAWIVERRKAADLKPADIAQRLGVSEPTVRGWETGRGVSADNVAALERLFGVAAPDQPEPADMSALVAALDRQATAINELVARLDGLSSQAIRDGIREALAEAGADRGGGASRVAPPAGR